LTRTLIIERDARAPGKAREAIAQFADEDLVPNASLLVSELMTNAVKYGTGPIELRLEKPGPGALRCEVADQGGGFTPVARSRPRTDVGGWGLYLVEALASSWGVRDGSTHVWFELSSAPED
jgi:anti-sigma regulatory factor (Ser/Thr protein kinase)